MMSIYTQHGFRQKQKGAVTIFTAVILLVVITLVVMYSGKVTIMEQKVSANDARAKVAFSTAEQGLNIASTNLKANTPGEIKAWDWVACVAGDTSADSCGDGSANVFDATWWHYTPVAADNLNNDCATPPANPDGYCVKYLTKTPTEKYAAYTIMSQGHADNGLASSLVTETISKFNFRASANGQVPPVMTPTPTIGGNMTIVANANTSGMAGRGNPISIWSKNAMAFGGAGSIQTCGALFDNNGDVSSTQCIAPGISDELGNELLAFNQCACASTDEDNDTYTDTNASLGHDVVQSDPDFPDDMFNYFFGTTDWQSIKDIADEVIDSCDQDPKLGSHTSGLIWVEGDCDISGPTLTDDFLGTRFTGANDPPEFGDGPVILVIEGDFTVSSNNLHIWGVVFIINKDGVSNTDSNVQLTGGPVIHGALLSDKELNFGGGGMTIMYDPEMLDALVADNDDDSDNSWDRLIPLTGSWNDQFPVFN